LKTAVTNSTVTPSIAIGARLGSAATAAPQTEAAKSPDRKLNATASNTTAKIISQPSNPTPKIFAEEPNPVQEQGTNENSMEENADISDENVDTGILECTIEYADGVDDEIESQDDADGEPVDHSVLWRSDETASRSEFENFGGRLLEVTDYFGEILQETRGINAIEKVRILGLSNTTEETEDNISVALSTSYRKDGDNDGSGSNDDVKLYEVAGTFVNDDSIPQDPISNTNESALVADKLSVEPVPAEAMLTTVIPILSSPDPGANNDGDAKAFQYIGSTFGIKFAEQNVILESQHVSFPQKRSLDSWCLSGGAPNFSKVAPTTPLCKKPSPTSSSKKIKADDGNTLDHYLPHSSLSKPENTALKDYSTILTVSYYYYFLVLNV